MRDDKKYLECHHQEAETAIGTARLHLKNGDPRKALKALDDCCEKLDDLTIKYQPLTATLLGLRAKKTALINERGE